jgi:MFS family permease
LLIKCPGAFATSLGLTQDQGGIVITILQVGTAIGRPFFGVLSDRFGRMTTAAVLTASNTVFILAIWTPATSYGVLIFFALLAGATSGVYWGVSNQSYCCRTSLTAFQTIAPLCAEVVDLQDLPSVLSLMWITVSMPSLCTLSKQIVQ